MLGKREGPPERDAALSNSAWGPDIIATLSRGVIRQALLLPTRTRERIRAKGTSRTVRFNGGSLRKGWQNQSLTPTSRIGNRKGLDLGSVNIAKSNMGQSTLAARGISVLG